MKNMKRFLSLMLAMMLCFGAFSMTALAVNPFTDVPTTEWYYSDIDHAYFQVRSQGLQVYCD